MYFFLSFTSSLKRTITGQGHLQALHQLIQERNVLGKRRLPHVKGRPKGKPLRREQELQRNQEKESSQPKEKQKARPENGELARPENLPVKGRDLVKW